MKHLVEELMLARHGRTAQEELTRENYERWYRGFIFDAIKDLRFGQAFCNHFGITDNLLFYERDIEKCQDMIKKRYL